MKNIYLLFAVDYIGSVLDLVFSRIAASQAAKLVGYVVLNLLVGLSCSLPLFRYFRQRKIDLTAIQEPSMSDCRNSGSSRYASQFS